MTIWFHIRRNYPTVAIIPFLVASFACLATPAAEPKRVMLLHSFGPDVKPWSDYARAIRSELGRQSPWPLDLYEHSLVTARFSGENLEAPFVEYLRAFHANHRPDLIVSIGAPAAAFVQRYRQQIFPTTPMLLTVVEQRRVRYSVLTPNDAVAPVAINYFGAMENILRVLPNIKSVAVVVGSSPIENFWKAEIGKEVKPFESRIAFIWYDNLSFDDILKHAAALPPQSAIFWELMVIDAAGVSHDEGRALTRLHAVANAPIFSYTDAFFGREIVGGPHVPVLEAGQKAAEAAIRILGGEKAGDIKIPSVGFGTPKFDWREMQRWGISESRLPPGSEIHFRRPTAWEEYRGHILAVSAAILIQAAMIVWLLYEHRRRHLAEILARNTMYELSLTNRIATAGELSASIAHEVNQPLTGIATRASAALRWLAADTPDIDKARAALTQIVAASHRASDIVTSIRAMFKKDTDERLPIDINKLILTVVELVRIELQRHDVELRMQLDGELPPVKGDQVQLQQVALNLIMNAIESMHSAQLRELRIRTELGKPNVVHVSIEDTGPGVDPSNVERIFQALFTTKTRGMGVGLSICRSIIERHNGRIWVSAGASKGANFQFELPIND